MELVGRFWEYATGSALTIQVYVHVHRQLKSIGSVGPQKGGKKEAVDKPWRLNPFDMANDGVIQSGIEAQIKLISGKKLGQE